MKLALLITARCNATCGHCSTSCGPARTESLSRDQLFELIDDAATLSKGEKLKVFLSGGEPFLDFELLLDVVGHGKRQGAVMTCVTNAYWATSPEKARDLLTAVKQAGLDSLAISTSRFHQQFVKSQRVERALAASRDVGLPCTLKYVRARGDARDEGAIRTWAKTAGAHDVQDFPLLPHLRAGVAQPEAGYIREAGVPEGRCPAPLLTVREDGRAFTCCTPGAFTGLLALGSATRDKLSEMNERFYMGGTQQILRESGPIAFARTIRERGYGDRLRNAYASVCDLCTHIACDPVMAAIATESAESLEVRQVTELLASTLQPHHSKENAHVHDRQ